MKQLKCIIKSFILISLIVSLSSCDMLSGGKDKGGKDVDRTKVGDTVQFLRFRPSNADALGVVDKKNGRSALARNVATDALIVKILEDGSFANFLTVPEGTQGEVAPISMILQSPDPETKCFFVVFKDESNLKTPVTKSKEYEDENGEIIVETWVENQDLTISRLLCVFEDGSYSDVLSNPDGVLRYFDEGEPEDFFTFDNKGNLFYIIKEQDYDSNVTVIYKYDPNTNTSKQLTPKLPDTWYQKIQVTAEGDWFFAQTLRNGGTRYLRAIPVSAPETYIDLFYASPSSGEWFDGWVYDDDAEALYYSKTSAIHKIPKVNGSFAKENDVILYDEFNSKWSSDDKDNGLFDASADNVDIFYVNDSCEAMPVIGSADVYGVDAAGTGKGEKIGGPKFAESITYEFKNKTTGEIQPEEIYNYILNNGLASFELSNISPYYLDKDPNGEHDYVFKSGLDDSYYLSFKKFANDKGYEQLAEVTKDKTNVEAIKAIFDNNLESLLGSLINPENTKTLYKNEGEPSNPYYKRNFYADVLYNTADDEPVSKDLFKVSPYEDDGFSTSGFYFIDFINLYSKINGKEVTWKTAYKAGNSVDAKKVLEKLASLCNQDEIDFKLTAFKELKHNGTEYSPLYTEKTNEEAIKFLDTPLKLLLLYKCITEYCFDIENYNGKFLNMTCFKKGTDESAYKLVDANNPQIQWGRISNFTPSYKKSLYGTDGKNFIEIVDKDGKIKGEPITLEGSPKLHIVSTVAADNGIYFLNGIDDGNGNETGKHNILYYDVPENKLTNLFENNAELECLEFTSFSGGDKALYFSAMKGFTALNGKIDIKTGAYQQLGSGESFSKMIVVR